MTEKDISKLIKSLNDDKYQDQIFLKSLSDKVDFAFVWIEKDYIEPYKIYFIKNIDLGYIGAVLDMSKDLHWFVEKKFRKNGYLTNALKDTILPHLFLNRKEQRITIDQSKIGEQQALNSEKVALKVGFEFTEKKTENYGAFQTEIKEYILQKKKVSKFIKFSNSHTISEERLKILQKRINNLSASISMINYEFEAAFGKSTRLKEIVKSLQSQRFRLEDSWWDFKRNK